MSETSVRTVAMMGTVVTLRVVARATDSTARVDRDLALDRAVAWFSEVESICTRFDPASELCRLAETPGVPVRTSPLLYEAVRFALTVAEASDGAFDPTVGAAMASRGFDQEFRTGRQFRTSLRPDAVSYRDVRVDAIEQTITLDRPLVLDLGAVAKGLAIDMASRELARFEDFAVDAGGDLYLGGRNTDGDPWSVGIRHPRDDRELIETVRVSNLAVCTSGDYERRGPGHGHHIIDPRRDVAASALASVTVIGPNAMLADALATAALVLGADAGLALLCSQGVEGLLVTPALERFETPGFAAYRHPDVA